MGIGYAVAASEVTEESVTIVTTGIYEEIMVEGFMVVVSASLVTVKEVAGTSIVLEDTSGVGAGVAELEGAADDEALVRRGVSLLTTQLDASSV
jgi:hypothetical protein